MAKKQSQPATRADELRRIANLRRGPTAEDTQVEDALGEYDEVKDAFTEYAEKAGEVESAVETLQEAVAAVDTLLNLGVFNQDSANEISSAVVDLETAMGYLDEVSPDTAGTFEEAYDGVREAWESYVNLKEQDRYDGKADDVASEWESVQTALHALADLADELGLS